MNEKNDNSKINLNSFDFLKNKEITAICGAYMYSGRVTQVKSTGIWITGNARSSKDSAGRYSQWDPLEDENSMVWVPFLISIIEVENY